MKKLLTLLLTVVIASTVGTVKLHAETYEITYVGNSGETISGNTTYIQNADSDADLVSGVFTWKDANNLYYELLGWDADNDGDIDFYINGGGTVAEALNYDTGNDGKVTLTAIWSPTLTIQYANISTVKPYNDVNPNNSTVLNSESFGIAGTTGYTIQDASQNNPTYHNVFNGWWYKDGTYFTKLEDNTIYKTLFDTLTTSGASKVNAVLTLYADWTYKVIYHDGTQNRDDSIKYQRDISNIYSTDTYTPVTVNPSVVPTTRDAYIEYINTPAYPGVYDYVYIDINDSNKPAGADDTFDYDYPTGRYNGFMFSKAGTTLYLGTNYYHFFGWDTDPSLTSTNEKLFIPANEINQKEFTQTENHLYAKYEQFQRVTYGNIGKAESKTAPDYVLLSELPYDIDRTAVPTIGYKFIGWNNSSVLSNFTSLDDESVDLITSDYSNRYGKWAYRVEFIDDTYSISNGGYIPSRASSSVNRNTIYNTGYAAYFADDAHTYIFNQNNGTNSKKLYTPATTNTEAGFYKKGYSIAGWENRNPNGFSVNDTDSDPNEFYFNATDLSALYTDVDQTARNSSYETSGGNPVTWNYFMIYAKWTPKTYTVTLNDNFPANIAGRIPYVTTAGSASVTTTYDAVFPEFTAPQLDGYTFDGYYTYDGEKVVNANGDLILTAPNTYTTFDPATGKYVWSYDGNVTLYAHWVENNYSLYFDKNDGQVNIETAKTKILTYDTEEFEYNNEALSGDLASVDVPSRTGYSFNGYYLNLYGGNRLFYGADGRLSMGLFNHQADHKYASDIPTVLFVNGNCENVTDSHHHFTATWVHAGNITLKASWTPIEYSITYNNMDGATMPSGYAATYNTETGATLPTPIRNGHNFLGWYTDSELTGEPVTTIPVGSYGNKVFYAKWEKATYNITLNVNGGAYADQYVAPSTYTYEAGATLPTSSNISKLGYDFVGWYAHEDFTGAKVTSISTTATGNKEFWLKWELIGYSITFNTNGGEYVDGYIVPSGYAVTSEVTLPTAANITKSGYTFAGWYTNSEPTGEPVTTISSGSTGNREYWANWINNSYTVHFNKNDDAATGEMADESFTYDVSKNLTANAFGKVGYHFVGWATSPTGPVVYTNGQSVSNLTGVANDTVNLYAKWEANTYTVNYINDFNFHTGHDIPDATKATFVAKNFDGSDNTTGTVSQIYTYDDATATYLPKSYNSTNGYEVFSLTGWHIKSWKVLSGAEYVDFTNFDENGKIINLTTENNGVINLKPVWERNTYTVVFNNNGGSGTMANQEFTYDDWDEVNNQSKYVALRKNSFTNSVIGKTEFNQWSTDATDAATGVTFINGQPVLNITAEDKATVTLYAIWSDFKPVNYYFNMGDTYTANYRENGLDADGTTVTPGKDPSNHDIDSTAAPYNITNTNIKKVLTSTTDKQKELSNKLIKRTGYDFGGFYKDADLTISVSKIDDLTEPYDVYVKWVPHTYTVTYKGNLPTGTKTYGGVTGNTDSVIEGTTANSNHAYDVASALTTNGYTLEGYNFIGWAETATGEVVRLDGVDHNNLTTLDGITIDLFAKWAPNQYSLVYDANKPATASSEVQGTTEEAALSRTYDVGSNLTANGYTLTGWTFLGWSTDKNATVSEFEDGAEVINLNTGGHATAEENTTTLYAVWQANTYTVDYDDNKPAESDNKVTNMPADPVLTYDVTYYTPIEAENPKLTNYTFAGWNTKADGTGVSYLTNVEIKNLTPVDGATFKLYAQWTLDNNISTTFDADVINDLGLPADTIYYVDGVKTALNADGGLTVPAGAKVLTTYTYADMGSITIYDEDGNPHVLDAGELDEKPATMKVFFVTENGLALDEKNNKFDNIFIYNGTSVRLSGNRGIRFRNAIKTSTYQALMGDGYEGYKVVEFGLLAAWKSATADPIYTDPQVKKAINYQIGTAPKNVKEVEGNPTMMYFEVGMIGSYSDDQMGSKFATRPYMVLRPVGATDSSKDIYLYGATIYRTISHESLYWINAKQGNTYRYAEGSSGYNYLNSTIVGDDREWIRDYPHQS